MRALLCKCTNSSSVFGGRLPVFKALSPRKVVSSLMRWLWNSDVAVVLQNPSWGELWRRRCCNKAVVLAPTHGAHGPLLLQAIGHQLHDIVKLPLAKLVEVGGRRRMGQQLHGGLVEEDPQVCPSFGSKHGRRQEAELGPRGATASKRNLCPGTCRPPPCKGTPAVLLRTHPGLCGGTHREPERGCCCGRRERPCSS